MTLEQISEDIRPRAAKMLLRQDRAWAQDLDDCLQNGLMVVWERLAADRDFLAGKSRSEEQVHPRSTEFPQEAPGVCTRSLI
jgi:hypothetical protein